MRTITLYFNSSSGFYSDLVGFRTATPISIYCSCYSEDMTEYEYELEDRVVRVIRRAKFGFFLCYNETRLYSFGLSDK